MEERWYLGGVHTRPRANLDSGHNRMTRVQRVGGLEHQQPTSEHKQLRAAAFVPLVERLFFLFLLLQLRHNAAVGPALTGRVRSVYFQDVSRLQKWPNGRRLSSAPGEMLNKIAKRMKLSPSVIRPGPFLCMGRKQSPLLTKGISALSNIISHQKEWEKWFWIKCSLTVEGANNLVRTIGLGVTSITGHHLAVSWQRD